MADSQWSYENPDSYRQANIPPDVLARLLASYRQTGPAGQEFSPEGYALNYNNIYAGGTGESWAPPTGVNYDSFGDVAGTGQISKQVGDSSYYDYWNEDGTYDSRRLDASSQKNFNLFLAAALGMAGGGYAAGGDIGFGAAGTGGAAGATGGAAAAGAGEAAAGGMANGAFLGEGVASGVGAWDAAAINSALGSGQLGTAASYAGQNLANGTASDTLGSMLNSGNTASNAVNAADVLNTGAKVAGTGLNLGGALGAVAGALSSKDQEQTTSRDPWKPAQPYLEGLLREGADLHGQMKAQPFNDAQKAGYNNYAGLLDLVNRNAGGLLSGAQANASGQNQFVRGQPRGLIGSSFNPSPQEWNPQSYGRFGG